MPAGFNSRVAFQREAVVYTPTWPSVTPSVATALLPLLSESVTPQLELEGLLTTDSKVSTLQPIVVGKSVQGTVLIAATFHGLEFFLVAALGFMAPAIDTVPLPEMLDVGIYRHLIEIDTSLSGTTWLADEGWIADSGLIAGQEKLRRGTYVANKDLSIWEARSCMIANLGFQTSPAGTAFSASIFGHSLTYFTAVNNTLLGLPCPIDFLDFSDAILYLSETAPLLSSNTVSDFVGFSFSLDNNLAIYNTTHTKTSIAEPRRSGPAVVTGSFALPLYMSTSIQLQEWAAAGTRLYGLLEFTGESLGDYNSTMRFWFPNITLTSLDIPISGTQQIQQVYNFVANKPESTPEGFPANIKTGVLMIEIINTTNNHALIS